MGMDYLSVEGEDGRLDQSCFGMGEETRIGESRIDDVAQAYEHSLTPDALINMREARRELRAQKAKANVSAGGV